MGVMPPIFFSIFGVQSNLGYDSFSLPLFLLSISDNFGALGQLDGLPRTYVSKYDCDILPFFIIIVIILLPILK